MTSIFTADRVEWRPHQGEPGTRLVGALTVVPTLIRQLGVDPAPVLAGAGVSPETLADPSGRIAWESAARVLSIAAARTDTPHFGLSAGREWRLGHLGLLGELVRHSPTVDSALRELVVNHHLNSEGALIFLRQQGDAVDLGYGIYVPFVESTKHFYDGFLAAAVNFLRELCGEGWQPSQVFFPHSPPPDPAPYRGCFGSPLRFDSAYCAVQFLAKWLARPVQGADAERLRLAREQVAAADKAVLVDRAYRALRTLLLHGKTSGTDVARSLAMHRRTLNRRLRSEGITFQLMLDRVRFAVAKELLEDSKLSLSEIASALAYTDGATLIPAFRRWTGRTPGAWRQAARRAPDLAK